MGLYPGKDPYMRGHLHHFGISVTIHSGHSDEDTEGDGLIRMVPKGPTRFFVGKI